MSRKPLDQLSKKRKRQKLRVLLPDEEEENSDQEQVVDLRNHHDDGRYRNVPEEGEHDIEFQQSSDDEPNSPREMDNVTREGFSDEGSENAVGSFEGNMNSPNGSNTTDEAEEVPSPPNSSVDDGDGRDSPESPYENVEHLGDDSNESESETGSGSGAEEETDVDSEEDIFEEANNRVEDDAYNAQFPVDDDWQNVRPLYQGAPLTVGQSMLLILAVMLHHNLNMLCIGDIITVINLHCLQNGLKKNNLFAFQKYFSLDQSNLKKYYYCSKCFRNLQSAAEQCPSCPRQKTNYFVGLPFTEQLKEMYRREDFYNLLQWRFQRPVQPEGSISDVYDGALYKEWMRNGFLQNPHNISFSWYTDGVPIFKSSQISIWPIFLTINELPFEHRKKMENTLLVGLWYGACKPNANTFLYKFRPEVEKIAGGVEVHLPDQRAITVRGVILMATCDLQAKAIFMNLVQYNGRYGCPACYCPGESIRINETSRVFAYRYEHQPRLRTLNETEDYGERANPDEPVMGVKGTAALSRLMPDFIRGMAIDRMHGIEGGVVKKMLKLFFDVKFRMFPFSLYNFRELINSRLTAIKPPKFVHRMPRSVDDLTHWKASELKLWFFHYSVPVLKGMLRDDYFEHYLLLVMGISLLNRDFITLQMRLIAKDFLRKFVQNFEQLYGLTFCSLNIHQVLHLADKVEDLGPLWVHSCFQYEDLNGQFGKLVHGTWHLDTQIIKKHEKIIAMIRQIELLPDGKIRDFCLSKKRQVRIIEDIFAGAHSVGIYKELVEVPEIIVEALRNEDYEYSMILQYLRLLKDKKLYVSKEYPRSLQTDSHIIKYTGLDGNWALGAVHSFLKLIPVCHCVGDCHCRGTHLALINKIADDDVFVVRGHEHVCTTASLLHKCHITDEMIVIEVASIETVCVHINVGGQMYVGMPVNHKDLE